MPETPASALEEQEQQILRLAVRLNLLDDDRAASAARLPGMPKAPAGARFVAGGALTQPQLNHLLATLAFKEERLADTRFGALAVEHGWATNEQIATALEEQKHIFVHEGRGLLLGIILVQQGVLTDEQAQALLLEQERVREAGPLSVKIIITHDHMRATLVMHPDGELPSAEVLQTLLSTRGIVHGIDQSTLQGIAAGEIAATEGVTIATGTPPTPPQAGSIEYLFDTQPLKGAREHGEGPIDLRDHGDVPQVPAGSIVARANLPVPGTPGTNVLGQPIPPAKPKETSIKVGKGVQLAPDKLSALASVEGRPTISVTGVLSVYPEYEIKGDVDNSTGHVNFHGRVVVGGAVRSGFRVRCGELVAKEIEGAEIHAEGDVTVNGGIIRAQIHTSGVLRTRYIHQSKVEALGDVIVGREVVDSQVETGGLFDSPECVILASRICAMNGIQTHEIGSETSSPCHIVSGVDERVRNETARIQTAIDEQNAAAHEIEHRLAAIAARGDAITAEIGPLAQLQDRALVRLRELHKANGSADKTETAALREQARLAEGKVNALLAEQEQLRKQKEADTATLAGIQEVRSALASEMAELKEWAAERTGRFLVRADLIHQQTLVTGPHLEVRLESDRKAANLTERERTDGKGHTHWQLVST